MQPRAKDLGLTCSLTMDWHTGTDRPEPAVGQFMMTPRGRTAYEIVGVRRVAVRRIIFGRTKLRLTCERRLRSDVPEWATVWEFTWYKRERKR